MNDDRRLATIRGLLAKADATDFPAEAEAFTAKAMELIAKFGIDEALAFAEGTTRDEIANRTMTVEGPYAADKIGMLNGIYSALGLKVIQLGNKLRDGSIRIGMHGYESDLDRAEILYTSLLLQGVRGMRDAPAGYSAASTAANRRAWLSGFSNRVAERITDAEQAALRNAQTGEHGDTSTALVLVDRKAAVANSYAAMYPRIKTVRRSLSGTGYGAGTAAGNRANIGQRGVTGARTALRA